MWGRKRQTKRSKATKLRQKFQTPQLEVFAFKLKETSGPISESKKQVKCHFLWNPAVVDQFKDDS